MPATSSIASGFTPITEQNVHTYGGQMVAFKTDSPFYGRDTALKVNDVFFGYVVRAGDLFYGGISSYPFSKDGTELRPTAASDKERLIIFLQGKPGQKYTPEHATLMMPARLQYLAEHPIAMRPVSPAELDNLVQMRDAKTMDFYPNKDSHWNTMIKSSGTPPEEL